MTRSGGAALAVVGAALGVALVGPLGLRSAAGFLVVADPLTHSDALYVFPGSVPQRAECAAALFRDGLAPRILVTGEKVRPELVAVGMPLSDAEVNARVLYQHGVPPEAVVIRSRGTSTWEDALALRDWATKESGLRHLTAVTSPHHSRRARRTLRAAFRGTGIDVRVQPCPAMSIDDWWRHEDTALPVINEYLKLIYYALAH
jgi:uncharacterized SAM-binding protein YcdF (DUF218 family)